MSESETTKIWEELRKMNHNLTQIITKTEINCPEQRRKIRRLEMGFIVLLIVFTVFCGVEVKLAWGMLKVVVPLLIQAYGGSI